VSMLSTCQIGHRQRRLVGGKCLISRTLEPGPPRAPRTGMLIGHLPAGYLLSRLCRRKAARVALLVGSILPDLNMLYFYFVDAGRVHHHGYPTHIPAYWTGVALCLWLLSKRSRLKGVTRVLGWGVAGVGLHLLLDSVAGDIRWLAPFSTQAFSLVHVQATRGLWIWNFVLHWTFLLEVGLVVVAAEVLAREQAQRRLVPVVSDDSVGTTTWESWERGGVVRLQRGDASHK
jgi:inner membrane protein